MDARERWQALQARLTAARAAVDAGHREAALVEITAALDLDAEFLAAHALRDRILTMGEVPPPAAPSPPASPPLAPSPSASQGLPAGYAKFEQRARRRRVDRRIDAARAAIDRQCLKAAAAALDEVIDIDPNTPELAALTASFDQLRRSVATPRRGPWLAAAAVFACAIFGGSWLQDSAPMLSRQIVSAASLPAPLTPTVMMTERLAEIGTTGVREAAPAAPSEASMPRVSETTTVLSPATLRLPAAPIDTPPVPRAIEAGYIPIDGAAFAPVSTPVPPNLDTADDNLLIKQTLQRYRTAYEGLDAESAQAVWPAVNQVALARAFEGLESQSLTFDACDVRVRGEAATATCHGSARYVTKVGSRDPRVEPRVWNFTLRKAASEWKIDSARAER